MASSSSAAFPITKQQQNCNVSFDCLQFVVSNSSQFPIYLTIGGSIPTVILYDYIIQPNSDFTSPLVNTRIINSYTPATNFNNTATITMYSYKHSEPNNTPYISNQIVPNTQSFPFTGTPTLRHTGFGGNLYQLVIPDIIVNVFQPLYLNVKGNNPVVAIAASSGLGITDMLQVNTFSDNVVGILPYAINTPLQYFILTPSNTPVTVEVFYTNQFIVKNNTPVFPLLQGNSITPGTFVLWSAAKPPAFYYDLILHSSVGSAYDINIQLDMVDTSDMDNIINLFSVHLVGGAVIGSTARVINPTFVLNPEFRFLKLTVTGNVGLTWDVSVNIYNYQ